MKNLLLCICIGVGAYQGFGYLKERRAEQAYKAFEASVPSNRAASRAGFVDAFRLDGIDPQVMTVLMPCGCPLAAGQRGRALVEKLKAANIPVTASSHAGVTVNGRSREEVQAQIDRMNRVMSGETPIVFYRGRAKNNPSFEDVQLEYQTSQ
jgi:hypothetical protein